METIKTKIHTYRYSLDKPAEAKEYQTLREKLNDGRHWMNCISLQHKKRLTFDTPDIELETNFLFSNQWNTVCGKRVFDHYEGIYRNNKVKEGHWLEITEEMREIRRNTLVCGFCGHYRQAAQGYIFCSDCLDSPYLKETELCLLRLKPVEQHHPRREPLTVAESAWLLPQYVDRQTKGNDSRAVKAKKDKRVEIKFKYEKEIKAAKIEFEGYTWLMDNGVSIENCLYYSHTDKFSFGWRSPVSASVKSKLLDILVEFPFDYEIK